MSKKEIELSGGAVTVKSISLRLLQQYQLSHVAPIPPQRQADVIGGTELVPDYEDADYCAALQAYNDRCTEDMLALLIAFGVEVTLPDDTSWVEYLKMSGISIPESMYKVGYVQYVLMSNFIDDLNYLTREILTLSGITEESISQWSRLF